MKKRNKKHVNRVKKLVVTCALCAIILTVSTYAWFIGMKTVNVSSFDVTIAAIDSLSLSLNGKDFDTEVTINSDNFDDINEMHNTNVWAGTGLIPVSTIGAVDRASSTMIMYEKGSLTTTAGGYRLMASEIANKTIGENQVAGTEAANGYVAFDLFIKNLSGKAYYEENNELNEEAIYLTTDSKVTVSDIANGGVAGTGIENSVRVAFAQIGRVIATTDDQAITTGLTCSGGTTGSTGICRTAQIWEPNDTAHVANAINWYTTSCLKRTGTNTVGDDSAYATACNTVENGTAYKTYAVSKEIPSTDTTVDVYDGPDYNGYNGSVENGSLTAYNYFTDTDKMKEGMDRPTFMTLAPNSITKVRVYVYIEGQDIDNYDFASLGKSINVGFGFTKERFYDQDTAGDGDSGIVDKWGTPTVTPTP